MIKKTLLGIFILIAALVGFAVFAILIPAGTFKKIEPHFDGSSKIIPIEIPGPEDIEIDRQEGLAFISVDDRRSNLKSPGSVDGGILMYPIALGVDSIKNITPSGVTDFHPHGISLYRSNDQLFLFAISHQTTGNQVVEKFEWKNDVLIHLNSYEDKSLMTSPNDIVAVGENEFYVTNDHYYMQGASRVVEEYLQRTISYVNYYDGKSFRTVATGIGYANGINQSPDGRYIYVAGCTERVLYVYEKGEHGNLTEVKKIALGTGPDNIDVDEEGNLLVACHPQLLKFVAHAKDVKKFSPSQVLKIEFNSLEYIAIKELFLNDGSMYSGSSIAVQYGTTLLIGSVFEPALLSCTMDPSPGSKSQSR